MRSQSIMLPLRPPALVRAICVTFIQISFLFVGNPAKATDCPLLAEERSLDAEWDQAGKQYDAFSEDEDCSDAAIALLEKQKSIAEKKIRLFERTMSRSDCTLRDPNAVGLAKLAISQVDGLLATCQSIGALKELQKKVQNLAPTCIIPPDGRIYKDQGLDCVAATNTNTNEKCGAYFSVMRSKHGSLRGPLVAPGRTDNTVCGSAGETLRFEKWTLVPSSAK